MGKISNGGYNKTILCLLPLILLSIMLINKNTNHNFKFPNEIVIYEHGIERKISKENLLYSKILTYTNERFETNLDMYKLSIAKDAMKKFKKYEVILEVVYTNKNDYNSPIGKLNEPNKLLELFNH